MTPDGYSLLRQDFIVAVLPSATAFVLFLAGAWLSGRFLLRRVRFRLRALGVNERGTSEMEFALAFPFFLMMVLVTIQMAFLINANLVVDYAAFCAARSAAVWVPYALPEEPANAIDADKDRSEKWQRIRRAAVIGCLPISPRLTGFVGDFLGWGSTPPTFSDGRDLGQLAGSLGVGPSIDYVRFGTDLVNKLAASYFLTDVELSDGTGQPARQFSGGASITATVTHQFYMNVPFAGPTLGAVLGRRYVAFFRPYYVPIKASYSLMVSRS